MNYKITYTKRFIKNLKRLNAAERAQLKKKLEILEMDPLYPYRPAEVRLFDAAPYATGSWYGRLQDERYFATVHLLPGGIGIEWEEGQDIAPHELYENSVPVKKTA